MSDEFMKDELLYAPTSIEEMRRNALEAISNIREQYERAAAPYFKILLDIEALQPRPMLIDPEVYAKLFPICEPSAPTGEQS